MLKASYASYITGTRYIRVRHWQPLPKEGGICKRDSDGDYYQIARVLRRVSADAYYVSVRLLESHQVPMIVGETYQIIDAREVSYRA